MNKYDVLKDVFGYENFRGNQEEIIDSLLNKNDTIAILATGGGKSICFQIPALLSSGITLVITPLISLMQNQVQELKKKKISAEYITSEMEFFELKKVVNRVINNKIKLLYISPERLENERYCAIFLNLDISYIIIDEAHCVSIWGHDFRPSYKAIKSLISNMENRPTIAAFTATANTRVINDIESVLDLKNTNVFKSGFDRPNLFYSVQKPRDKMKFLLKQLLSNKDDIFLIYTVTRKEATTVYNKLLSLGFKVGLYHGALDSKEKEECLKKFMSEELKIIVATNAFGMGINKPNIRHVINYSLPLSMEDLSQQSGRCSRDGNYGNCILLFNEEDIKVCEYFIKKTKCDDKKIEKELIKEKYKQLRSVINYATTNKCLHHTILDYFHEMSKNKCFMCTNCEKRKKK